MISKTELIMNIFLISVVFFIHFALSFEASSSVGCASPVKGLRSNPRPIYNIKRNTGIAEVRDAIKKGANGVYNLLDFNKDGTPDSVGKPFSFGDKFTEYISFLKGLIEEKAGSQLVMIMFGLQFRDFSSPDNKDLTASYIVKGLADLMKKAHKNFFVILEVPEVCDISIFQSNHLQLNHSMKSLFDRRLGFAVHEGHAKKNAEEFTIRNIRPNQVWQTSKIGQIWDSSSEFSDSIQLRNSGNISKVLMNCEDANERQYRKEKYLREGADGLITDKPHCVTEILEKNSDDFRLATLEDNPF